MKIIFVCGGSIVVVPSMIGIGGGVVGHRWLRIHRVHYLILFCFIGVILLTLILCYSRKVDLAVGSGWRLW